MLISFISDMNYARDMESTECTTGMPLTYHKKVRNYIYLLLCPLSIYYYSAGSKYKHMCSLHGPRRKQAQN